MTIYNTTFVAIFYSKQIVILFKYFLEVIREAPLL